MKKLSIVIPCYNEEESLPALLEEINTALDRDDVQVILVNNGSGDGTAHILKAATESFPRIASVTCEKNLGYGGGILEGLRHAEGTYVGWMHGDLQTPFKDALRALSHIESMGNPEDIYIKGLRRGRSFFDTFFTIGMSIFESLLFQTKMFDINAQPNIFHRNFYASWQNPPRDFSLDLYALYMARTRNMRVVRIPVFFPPRKHGQSHWNTGIASRLKFIKRTIAYSLALKRRGA